jgi:MFS transporter, DHA1 family, tetracycline resistance protein
MTVWTTVVIDLIGFGIAIPVLGPFAQDLGASPFVVGLIGAAFSLAQFVVAPLLGRLSDRIGRKKVLLLSLVGTCIASIASGLSTLPWMLMASRAFDGASGATLGVAQAAVADITPPHRRAKMLGMLGAAFGIGFTIGPAIAGIATLIGGRRAPFFVAAALAGANAIATFVRFHDAPKGTFSDASAFPQSANSTAGVGPSERLATTWRDNGLPLVLSISALTVFAFSMFESMFTLYGKKNIGFTQETAAYAFVIVGIVASIVQGGLIGKVLPKFGETRTLRFGMIAVTVGLVLIGVTRSWLVLVPVLLLLAAGQGFASPTMQATITNRIDDSKRGELLGVVQRWGSLARVVGPPVGGFLFQHVAISSPFFFGAAIYAVCVLAMISKQVPNTYKRT